jgi:hypothetical protein
MKSLSVLQSAEEKVERALAAYSQDTRHDSAVHERLIDELAKATSEFLYVREQVFRGI